MEWCGGWRRPRSEVVVVVGWSNGKKRDCRAGRAEDILGNKLRRFVSCKVRERKKKWSWRLLSAIIMIHTVILIVDGLEKVSK